MKKNLLIAAVAMLACQIFAADPKVKVERNLVYGKGGDVDLKLDLARPEGDGPFPVVVCYHGGGWQGGDKATYSGLIHALARRGYVAATVQYRFTPRYKFPAQVEDAKCAVRFLRAHARDYRLDPNRVAVMGHSAGGHLSLMVGLMEKSDALEGTGGWADQSSKANLIINYFGPTDFPTWLIDPTEDEKVKRTLGKTLTEIIEDFTGTGDRNSKVMSRISPITYVDPKDPPVLTFQGTADPLVALDQAKKLHARLKEKGVEEELVILEGAGHGWGGKELEKTNARMFEFLEKHFGKNSRASTP